MIRATLTGGTVLAETRYRKGSRIAYENLGLGFLTDSFGHLSVLFCYHRLKLTGN